MTYRECRSKAMASLTEHYGEAEARWMVRIIFECLKGMRPVDLVIKAGEEVSDYIAGKVDSVVQRLLHDEPIQYIFGVADFYGLKLEVTPATLIPRPETEELVDMIVRANADKPDLRVLDICTGSGCIAIALARNLRFAQIDAIDISADAIEVAKRNAQLLRTRVTFKVDDALNLPKPSRPQTDIIVSNPPYIAERERTSMARNVIDHEPSTALFVPDSDPILFYRAIADYAITALVPGGQLYFELNPLYANDVRSMLRTTGFSDIAIIADMQRKNRFAKAVKPID